MRRDDTVRVKIEDVDLTTIETPLAYGRDLHSGGLYQIDLARGTADRVIVPSVGEEWWLHRRGGRWQLEGIVDEGLARAGGSPAPGGGGGGGTGPEPTVPQTVALTFYVLEKKTTLEYSGKVTWTPPANADVAIMDEYEIQIRPTDISGTPIANTHINTRFVDSDIDPLEAIFEHIPNPKHWYWEARVRGINTGRIRSVWSDWTAPILPFTAALPQPPAPTNIVLAFDVKERDRWFRYRALVTWDEVVWDIPGGDDAVDIDRYQVQLQSSTDGGTTWQTPVQNKLQPAKADSDSNTTDTVVFFPVSRFRTFQARVRSIDRFNRRGLWSNWTTAATPSDGIPPPDPTSVSAFVLYHRIGLKWDFPADLLFNDNSVLQSDLAYFQVQLSDTSNFSSILEYDRQVVTQRVTFHIKKISSTQYYLRVRAKDAGGQSSNWVSVGPIELDKPTAVTGVSIAYLTDDRNRAERLSARITWDELNWVNGDIDRYVVQLQSAAATDTTFASPVDRFQVKDSKEDSDANDYTATLFDKIYKHRIYRARVRAISKGNVKGTFSGWFPSSGGSSPLDTTAPPLPQNLQVDVEQQHINIFWDAPTDPNDNDSAGTPTGTLAAAITSTSATTISVTETSTPPATPFDIRIDTERMTVTGRSGAGPFTYTVTRGVAQTTAATHLISAPVNIVLLQPSLDVQFYQVQVATKAFDAGNFTFSDIKFSDRYVANETKSWRVKKPAGNYYVRVRSVDASGNKSAWAPLSPGYVSSASQVPAAPPVPTITFDNVERDRMERVRAIVAITGSYASPPVTLTAGGQALDEEIAHYEIELQGSGTTSFPSGATIERRHTFLPVPSTDDQSEPYKTIFPLMKVKNYYRARSRAVDRMGRTGAWSAWGPTPDGYSQALDSSTAPDPTSVAINVRQHHIIVSWDIAVDTNDTDAISPALKTPSQDVFHFQVQTSQDNFTNIIDSDRYVLHTNKVFRVKKPGTGTWYARVRSVDASGNKSGYVAVNSSMVQPGSMSAPTITIDTVDKDRFVRLRALVTFSAVTSTEDDIEKYILELQSSSTNSFTNTDPRRHAVVHTSEGDANDPLTQIFTNIRDGYFYRARVRGIDKEGIMSATWSNWSTTVQADDGTTPPLPTNVTTTIRQHHIIVEWDSPTDSEDADTTLKVPHKDIFHFQVQLSTSSTFASILQQDRYVVHSNKHFKVAKPGQGKYYARVRTVDGSGNKSSSWVDTVAVANLPVQTMALPIPPVAPTIAFEGIEADRHFRLRAAVTVTAVTNNYVGTTVGTLAAAINTTGAITASVTETSTPPSTPFDIVIDSERMTVTARSGGGPFSYTVTSGNRGVNGTTAATHVISSTVSMGVSADDDVEKYAVETQQSQTTSFGPTGNRHERTAHVSEGDSNDPLVALYHPVRHGHYYRSRARAIDKMGRMSVWSPWGPTPTGYLQADYTGGSPTVPVPTSVTSRIDYKRVELKWAAPADANSPNVMDKNISHFQVQFATKSNFTEGLVDFPHVVHRHTRIIVDPLGSLNADITTTTNPIVVNETQTPPSTPFDIIIDSERITVTTRTLVSGSRYSYAVTRHTGGTSAAAHTATTKIAIGYYGRVRSVENEGYTSNYVYHDNTQSAPSSVLSATTGFTGADIVGQIPNNRLGDGLDPATPLAAPSVFQSVGTNIIDMSAYFTQTGHATDWAFNHIEVAELTSDDPTTVTWIDFGKCGERFVHGQLNYNSGYLYRYYVEDTESKRSTASVTGGSAAGYSPMLGSVAKPIYPHRASGGDPNDTTLTVDILESTITQAQLVDTIFLLAKSIATGGAGNQRVEFDEQGIRMYTVSLDSKVITLSGWTGINSFKLTFGGVESAAIVRGAGTAANVKAALEALSTITPETVTVTGTTDAGPFTVSFDNASLANQYQSTSLTVTSGTGGTTGTVVDTRPPDNLVVNIPTNGNVSFKNAEIEAAGLSVTGNASFSGPDNIVDLGAVMGLASSVGNPKTAPTLSQSWDQMQLGTDSNPRASLTYSPTGGSGGTQPSVWTMDFNAGGDGFGFMREFSVANGTQTRSRGLGNRENHAIVRAPSATVGLWVLNLEASSGDWFLSRYPEVNADTASPTISDTRLDSIIDLTTISAYIPGLFYDGTYLCLVGVNPSTSKLRIHRFSFTDTSITFVDTMNSTGSPSSVWNPTFDPFKVRFYGGVKMTEDARTQYWIAFKDPLRGSQVKAWDNTSGGTSLVASSTRLADYFYGANRTEVRGVIRTDSNAGLSTSKQNRFWTLQGNTNITKHTDWRLTGTTNGYYARYTWSSSSPSAETRISNSDFVPIEFRSKAKVSLPSPPLVTIGGVPVQLQSNVYVYNGDTSSPNNGGDDVSPFPNYHLQASGVNGNSIDLETYNSGGATPPTINTFGGDTPGAVESHLQPVIGTLNGDILSTATSLNITENSTEIGSANSWIRFDIMIDDERIAVTARSGTPPTITYGTIVRHQGGTVAAPHVSGTNVYLANPLSLRGDGKLIVPSFWTTSTGTNQGQTTTIGDSSYSGVAGQQIYDLGKRRFEMHNGEKWIPTVGFAGAQTIKGGNQSIASGGGTNTGVIFASAGIVVDTHGYDNLDANNRWVIPNGLAGMYRVYAIISWATRNEAQTTRRVKIRKNGSVAYVVEDTAPDTSVAASATLQQEISMDMVLNVTDNVDIVVTNTASAAVNVQGSSGDSTKTLFGLTYLGPA